MRREKLTIKKLGINGEGIGYIDKKICFIKNALVGEEVEVEVDVEERRYMLAHVTNYLQKSSARVDPVCNETRNCMGCALMHMNYLDQLPYKKGLIKDAIAKYTSFDPERLNVKPVLACETPLKYRHYVAFPITYFAGEVRVGIYQRESKFLTLMDHCPLHTDLINEALVKIQEIFNDHKCRDYNDKIKKGLRFLMVRQFGDALQVVIVTGMDGIKDDVVKDIEALPYVKSVYYTSNTTKYQDFTLQGYKKLYGANEMHYHINDHVYAISVKSDIFMNPAQEEKKIEILKNKIKPEDKVLSLYCQTGILEMELPNDIVAIDESKFNIEDAKKNALSHGCENKKFIMANMDEEVAKQCKRNEFDTIIVSLRKEYMSEFITRSIKLGKIKNVILISDNASALAKGIHELEDHYKISLVEGFDMEPYTARVESMITLTRR